VRAHPLGRERGLLGQPGAFGIAGHRGRLAIQPLVLCGAHRGSGLPGIASSLESIQAGRQGLRQ